MFSFFVAYFIFCHPTVVLPRRCHHSACDYLRTRWSFFNSCRLSRRKKHKTARNDQAESIAQVQSSSYRSKLMQSKDSDLQSPSFTLHKVELQSPIHDSVSSRHVCRINILLSYFFQKQKVGGGRNCRYTGACNVINTLY